MFLPFSFKGRNDNIHMHTYIPFSSNIRARFSYQQTEQLPRAAEETASRDKGITF